MMITLNPQSLKDSIALPCWIAALRPFQKRRAGASHPAFSQSRSIPARKSHSATSSRATQQSRSLQASPKQAAFYIISHPHPTQTLHRHHSEVAPSTRSLLSPHQRQPPSLAIPAQSIHQTLHKPSESALPERTTSSRHGARIFYPFTTPLSHSHQMLSHSEMIRFGNRSNDAECVIKQVSRGAFRILPITKPFDPNQKRKADGMRL